MLTKCTDIFMDKLKENLNRDFNISIYAKNYAMDTLANCVFGMQTNMQNNEKNKFFEHANNFLDDCEIDNPFFLLNSNENYNDLND
jgi:hypothetical protein